MPVLFLRKHRHVWPQLDQNRVSSGTDDRHLPDTRNQAPTCRRRRREGDWARLLPEAALTPTLCVLETGGHLRVTPRPQVPAELFPAFTFRQGAQAAGCGRSRVPSKGSKAPGSGLGQVSGSRRARGPGSRRKAEAPPSSTGPQGVSALRPPPPSDRSRPAPAGSREGGEPAASTTSTRRRRRSPLAARPPPAAQVLAGAATAAAA